MINWLDFLHRSACKPLMTPLKEENSKLLITLKKKESALEALKMRMAVLQDAIKPPNQLEHYWNNKRAKKNTYYNARDSSFDVRYFWNAHDGLLPRMSGTNDEKANKALKYVIKRVQYVLDQGEFWQFSYETMKRRKGDCEDGAILMANIMLKSGIPYWRIRLNAGTVKSPGADSTIGHAYVTYFREEDDKWYVLDWCYWPSESIGFKKKWDDAKKYFGIWFSWNAEYCFNEDSDTRNYFDEKQ